MNLKSQRGSMAVYVTIVLLSMIFILLTIFFISNSTQKIQLTTVMKIKQAYEMYNANADKIYRNLISKLENNYVYIDEFDENKTYQVYNTNYNINNGIITLESTAINPQLDMYNITSFSPLKYRYIDVKYKLNVQDDYMGLVFEENPIDETYLIKKEIIGDGQWHIATFDLWSNVAIKNKENITGWIFNWATKTGVSLDIDYIKVRN